MPIHITIDQAVSKAAVLLMSGQTPPLSDDRQAQILPAKKFNLLVDIFNGSTILLTVAVASAILFAYTMAVCLGAMALFSRWTAERELFCYAIPVNAEFVEGGAIQRVFMNTIGWGIRNNLSEQILERLGCDPNPDWDENALIVFDHILWKNKVDMPPIPE